MAKILLLFTHSYPFAPPSEQFLQNEIPYLAKEFDKVILFPVSRTANAQSTRELHFENVTCNRLNRLFKGWEIIKAVFCCAIFCKTFYSDIIKLFRHKAIFNKNAWLQFFTYHTNSYIIYSQAYGKIKTYGISCDDKIVLYSYWLSDIAYGASLIKRKLHKKGYSNIKLVSRAHGSYDIYISEKAKGFKPCLDFMCNTIDTIYSISTAGKVYLQKIGFKNEIKTSYIGVIAPEQTNIQEKTEPRELISCSMIVPVKRLDKIVESLSHIYDKNVRWTHFGGGPLQIQISEKASKQLPDNIQWEIKGVIANEDILKYYEQHPSCIFINVSAIEGIPVSIMEAISFGFPIIAANVGGNNEICIDGYNGILLNSDFTDNDLMNAVNILLDLSPERYLQLCKNSYSLFESKFDCQKNFTVFTQDISNLL